MDLKTKFQDEYNRRNGNRYTLKDSRVWHFHVGEHDLPIKWVQNVSTHGLQVCYRKYDCFEVGEELPIDIRYMGKRLLYTKGVVRWRRKCQNRINLFELGIELLDSDDKVTSIWRKEKIFEQVWGEEETKSVSDKAKAKRNWMKFFNETEVIATVTASFMLGYLISLYNNLYGSIELQSPVFSLFKNLF